MSRVTKTNTGETISVHIITDHMPTVGISTIFYYYSIIFLALNSLPLSAYGKIVADRP